MTDMLFDSWQSICRTLIVGLLAYVTLVALLRISGLRTLSKMNAFDFVVTIALGSTLATALLSKDVSLASGAASFGLLIALQFCVTWTSARWPAIKRVVTGEPLLLLHRGVPLDAAMRRARVTRDELAVAVRSAGYADFADVSAIVLETDGSFTAVPASNADEPTRSTAFADVRTQAR